MSAQANHLRLDPNNRKPLLKSQPTASSAPSSLPLGKKLTHPTTTSSGNEDASIFWIGNATTVLEWNGIRILTDPNFLHAGDHVHLGPGVTGTRLKDPFLNLDELPPLDCILLSHYHEDHFDRLVEDSLNRDFPIISTPHAKKCLTSKDDPFRAVHDLDFFSSLMIHVSGSETNTQERSTWQARDSVLKITAMPGKHVPPGPLSVANEIIKAVPPTNGWLVEMGYSTSSVASTNIPPEASAPGGADPGTAEDPGRLQTGYRIYISGDTLFVDELKAIPKWLKNERIDLMLVHLGGTTIPGPKMPLVMVTMDGKQGLQLMRLIDPDVTIPIHFDDYDVMFSGLDDFQGEVGGTEYEKRVVYLKRGEQFWFKVKE